MSYVTVSAKTDQISHTKLLIDISNHREGRSSVHIMVKSDLPYHIPFPSYAHQGASSRELIINRINLTPSKGDFRNVFRTHVLRLYHTTSSVLILKGTRSRVAHAHENIFGYALGLPFGGTCE